MHTTTLKRRLLMFAAPLIAIGVMACEDSTSPAEGTGTFSVALTDAPSTMFAEAIVDIGAIQLVGGDGPPDHADERRRR